MHKVWRETIDVLSYVNLGFQLCAANPWIAQVYVIAHRDSWGIRCWKANDAGRQMMLDNKRCWTTNVAFHKQDQAQDAKKDTGRGNKSFLSGAIPMMDAWICPVSVCVCNVGTLSWVQSED